MTTSQNRTWSFPPTVEVNLEIKKVCKRFAYKPAYFLLTFAYKPVYCPAYLHSIGRAGSRLKTQTWLVLRIGKVARPRASC
jgi:hypothetical protein